MIYYYGNVTRIHLHPDVHAMILELKHINQTPQSSNSSIKVMHLLENQENNQNILQDSPAMFVCLSSKFPSFKIFEYEQT